MLLLMIEFSKGHIKYVYQECALPVYHSECYSAVIAVQKQRTQLSFYS